MNFVWMVIVHYILILTYGEEVQSYHILFGSNQSLLCVGSF